MTLIDEVPLGAVMVPVIRSFKNQSTADVFDGVDSKVARRTCPRGMWPIRRRKLDQIHRVRDLNELSVPPVTGWSDWPGTAVASTAFASMTSIVSVSFGKRGSPMASRSRTITSVSYHKSC